jgi:hypothetical protein
MGPPHEETAGMTKAQTDRLLDLIERFVVAAENFDPIKARRLLDQHAYEEALVEKQRRRDAAWEEEHARRRTRADEANALLDPLTEFLILHVAEFEAIVVSDAKRLISAIVDNYVHGRLGDPPLTLDTIRPLIEAPLRVSGIGAKTAQRVAPIVPALVTALDATLKSP